MKQRTDRHMLQVSIALHATLQKPFGPAKLWQKIQHDACPNSSTQKQCISKLESQLQFLQPTSTSRMQSVINIGHMNLHRSCLPASKTRCTCQSQPASQSKGSASTDDFLKESTANKQCGLWGTYLLCTSVDAVWGVVTAGTAAPTCDLAEVSSCHECLTALAPSGLQTKLPVRVLFWM